MIYLPIGRTITISTSFMQCNGIIEWWFNPKDGSVQKIDRMKRSDTMELTTPTKGTGNDWVLIIDDAKKNYKEPGK